MGTWEISTDKSACEKFHQIRYRETLVLRNYPNVGHSTVARGQIQWTCLIPVVPIVLYVDGILSCMRTYSPLELRELTEELSARDYQWEIGRARGRFMPISVTYLVGYPNSTPFPKVQDGPNPSLPRKRALQ